MKRTLILSAALVFDLFGGSSAHAYVVNIAINSGTGLYNTGLDSAGVVLADNAVDPHYVGAAVA